MHERKCVENAFAWPPHGNTRNHQLVDRTRGWGRGNIKLKKIKNGSAKISQNKQMQMRRKAGGKSAARKVHVNKDRQRQLSRGKKKKKQYFRIPLAASKPGKHTSIFDKISWHPDEMQVSGAPSGRI